MVDIFLLAGPPAVGKSTTARALAAQFPKSIHISVDQLRDMVVSGQLLPGSDWSQGLIEQLSLARKSAVCMAGIYHQAGFVVVLDDFWDPNSQLSEYATLMQKTDVHKILLFPSQQTAEQRNLKRAGSIEGGAYISNGIRAVYARLVTDLARLESQGWMIAETTHQSVEATVQSILAHFG